MKLLYILALSFVLAGCGMSIEEYNARVKYCNDNGMETKLYRNNIGDVYSVACVDGKGSKFSSKEAK